MLRLPSRCTLLTKPLLRCAAIILGGGAGSRLYPLTKQRAKPAVPIGGAYRLIDVPMSNCINSGISKIYVLTQFNSTSLNRHLARTYNFGNGVKFGGDGFVEVQLPTEAHLLAGTQLAACMPNLSAAAHVSICLAMCTGVGGHPDAKGQGVVPGHS